MKTFVVGCILGAMCYVVYVMFIAPVAIERRQPIKAYRMTETYYITDSGMSCLILGTGRNRVGSCDWARK